VLLMAMAAPNPLDHWFEILYATWHAALEALTFTDTALDVLVAYVVEPL